MHLFRPWMLLPVEKKLTFKHPPPPPPLLSVPRGATNPGPSDVLRSVRCTAIWRISDVREYPGVSYESSSMVFACTMVTDMEAPETVVLKTDCTLPCC